MKNWKKRVKYDVRGIDSIHFLKGHKKENNMNQCHNDIDVFGDLDLILKVISVSHFSCHFKPSKVFSGSLF